ncbi:hypothetical protein LPB90_18500 [Chryseobacterium sp. LC2016-29]|uniref:hypothetical protein n=1 Tax=Chryseobacterium sp. LC2016-29 TaxID=2897331 RepID=UPI001E622B18|nr:hypothetical protein [Chryseobacterium sp. LC2016-29]MCD0480434.1 hypothetical protein [Chryseobacterium sp. LC2016-29]
MNTKSYNLIKGRSDLFKVNRHDIPFNMSSQNPYNGMNAFSLIVEARLYKKEPVFITPLQVSKLGGNIIPPSDLVFKKEDIWKFYPGVEQNNVEKFRKELYLLYIKGKLETTNEIPSSDSLLKITGGVYFDVFTKSVLHNKIYIDGKQGLNSSDVNRLNNMFYDDIKSFLEETGINYYTSSTGINPESCITLSNIISITNHKVVSIDDVCGLKIEELSKSYLLNSEIYKNDIREVKDIYDKLSLMLSEKFTMEPIVEDNCSSIELIRKLFRQVSKIEVLSEILKSKENTLGLNKDLLIELTTNSLFNKIGLYGFDDSFKYFLELVNNSPSYSVFKESHLLLQKASYSISKNILGQFNYNSIKALIENVGKLSLLKSKIKEDIKTLSNINLYEKLPFSSKGNLTIYDVNKLKYQLVKNGTHYLFNNWIGAVYKSHSFEENLKDDTKLKVFLAGLSAADKKSIKSSVLENYYNAKALGEREHYQSQNINFDIFGADDFKAFISQNSIKSLIEFFYTKLDPNLVAELDSTLTDDNKISFRIDINKKLDKLHSAIKENYSTEELKFFHTMNNIQRER